MNNIKYLKSSSRFSCTDLYGFVIKRVFDILSKYGRHGFIVMHNLAFSRNFKDVRKLILNKSKSNWFSFYSRIPSGLFDGSVRVRNAIYLTAPNEGGTYTTRLHRWFAEQRSSLLNSLKYSSATITDVIPMLNDCCLQKIYENNRGKSFIGSKTDNVLYAKKTAYNCLPITHIEAPTYCHNTIIESDCSRVYVQPKYFEYAQLLCAGKILFTRWLSYGDDFHLTSSDVSTFIFPFEDLSNEDVSILHSVFQEFIAEIESTLRFKLNAGKNVGTYNPRALWHLTDRSDLIFMKYLSDNPIKEFEAIENLIAVSVISDKK